MRTICIIGAGASGLAALQIILQSPHYKRGEWKPFVFEARDNVGGIWLSAGPETDNPPITPQYDSLITNLPHPLMCYRSFGFPISSQVFPPAAKVQEYLELYSSHFNLYQHIRLLTRVDHLERNGSGWIVQLSTGGTMEFDIVIVANGHYRQPRYPDHPGVQDWIAESRASHSAWYRAPKQFSQRKFLVVGSGPSGIDVSADLVADGRIVVHSVKDTLPGAIESDRYQIRGLVKQFLAGGRVEFVDGTFEQGIEHCILATGFRMSIPFLSHKVLREGDPSPTPSFPTDLYNSSYHIFPLARHVFPIDTQPTLLFMGLPNRVSPLPLVEAQAMAIVRVLADPASFDLEREKSDILARYERLSTLYGPTGVRKEWHRLRDADNFDYRDSLYAFARSREDEISKAYASLTASMRDWEKEMYDSKMVLRKVWEDLVAGGKADDFVRGVGENGVQDWIDLLRKMLEMAK